MKALASGTSAAAVAAAVVAVSPQQPEPPQQPGGLGELFLVGVGDFHRYVLEARFY